MFVHYERELELFQ